eukprot:TRINITY_DN7743_c0_g1_i3.p1 TRINITY_DN7743_c0_g1~~TRINITY_DN7743_c0_g1_i3.p1  ORF type:complete len:580 (+),score=169.11 TRINITY_DN7743_c0_g1_i3:60-1799(+)
MTATAAERFIQEYSRGGEKDLKSFYATTNASTYTGEYQFSNNVAPPPKNSGFAKNNLPLDVAHHDPGTKPNIKATERMKSGTTKRLEHEGPETHWKTVAQTSFGAPPPPPDGSEDLPPVQPKESSGYSRNAAKAPIELKKQAAPKPVSNIHPKILQKLRHADPTEAENDGQGPAPMSSTYNSNFNSIEAVGPGQLVAAHLKTIPQGESTQVSIGVKSRTAYNMAVTQLPDQAAGQEEYKLSESQKRAAQGNKKLEYEGNVYGSIYRTSFLQKPPEDGTEDMPPVNKRDNASGYKKGNAHSGGIPGAPPRYDGMTGPIHPKTLATIKVHDPVEWKHLTNPGTYVSTYQANFEKGRPGEGEPEPIAAGVERALQDKLTQQLEGDKSALTGGARGVGAAGTNGAPFGTTRGSGVEGGAGTSNGEYMSADAERASARARAEAAARALGAKKGVSAFAAQNVSNLSLAVQGPEPVDVSNYPERARARALKKQREEFDDGSGEAWKTVSQVSFVDQHKAFPQPEVDPTKRKLDSSGFTKPGSRLHPIDDPVAAEQNTHPSVARMFEMSNPMAVPSSQYDHKKRHR